MDPQCGLPSDRNKTEMFAMYGSIYIISKKTNYRHKVEEQLSKDVASGRNDTDVSMCIFFGRLGCTILLGCSDNNSVCC